MDEAKHSHKKSFEGYVDEAMLREIGFSDKGIFLGDRQLLFREGEKLLKVLYSVNKYGSITKYGFITNISALVGIGLVSVTYFDKPNAGIPFFIGILFLLFSGTRAWRLDNDRKYRRIHLTNQRLVLTSWQHAFNKLPPVHIDIRQAPLEFLSLVRAGDNTLTIKVKELGKAPWTKERLAQSCDLPSTSNQSLLDNGIADNLIFSSSEIDRLVEPISLIDELEVLANSDPAREMPTRR